MKPTYETLADRHEPAQYAGEHAAPVKMWTRGVPIEAQAAGQLLNTARMPFIFKHLAVMPDDPEGLALQAQIQAKLPPKPEPPSEPVDEKPSRKFPWE